MKKRVTLCLVLAAVAAAAHPDLYAPSFTANSMAELQDIEVLTGASANCASEDLVRNRYNFHLWHKKSEDNTIMRYVINSGSIRRTSHGGPMGFPGTTNFPSFTLAQDSPDPWDRTLSSTFDYELREPFDMASFLDPGVSRDDMRTWDLYWRTMYAAIQDPETPGTGYGDDPCTGLTGVVGAHCRRCTICNKEPDRGYCPDTNNTDALNLCVDECWSTALSDDCWIQAPRNLETLEPTGVPLTVTLGFPSLQFENMVVQTVSILDDCHLENETCLYCGLEWAHTHPSGIPDSDLSPPYASFEYDVWQCPIGGPTQASPCTFFETARFFKPL